MKHLFLILLTIVAVKANALVASEEQVIGLCGSLSFDSNKQACLKVVTGNEFDTEALDLCKGISFDSNKIECLTVIANKGYSPAVVGLCKQSSFDSNKISCLKSAQTFPLYPDDDQSCSMRQVKRDVRDALKALRRGDSYSAERILQDVLNDLSR